MPEQAQLRGAHDCSRSRVDFQLAIRVLDMRADGMQRNTELLTDGFVGATA
jgi:hypothetical protein